MHINEIIYSALKLAIEDSGSQNKFSKKTAVPQATINKILSRKTNSLEESTWTKLYPFLKQHINYNIFGKYLQETLERQNITSQYLISKLDINQELLNAYLSGKEYPGAKMLLKLEQILKVELPKDELENYNLVIPKKNIIKILREYLNITQDELAWFTNINKRLISDYENAKKYISREDIKKLSDSFRLSYSDLFSDQFKFEGIEYSLRSILHAAAIKQSKSLSFPNKILLDKIIESITEAQNTKNNYFIELLYHLSFSCKSITKEKTNAIIKLL